MKHLDEGTIHAWLDGALSESEGTDIEAHIATCADCAERVREARGLIAGASRILLALDDVGTGVVPARPAEVQRTRVRRWVRPVSWLAAAGLLLAVGVRTMDRVPEASTIQRSDSVPVVKRDVGAAVSPAPIAKTAPPPAKPKDAPVKVAAGKVAGVQPPPAVTGGAAAKVVAAEAMPARDAQTEKAATTLDSTERRARMLNAPRGMNLQEVVTTSAADRAAAPASARMDAMSVVELGRAPVCFIDADSRVLMLDSTSAPEFEATRSVARQLRDSSGVVGAWQRLGADSVELRFAGRVVLALVSPAGLKAGPMMMARTECGRGKK